MRERDIAQALAEREDGQCEVKTPAGKIDVLTPKYLYEVKVARNWKAALGQVLAYARAYPNHKPRLYLFGDKGAITKRDVEEHCRATGVGVVWHRDEEAPPRSPRAPKIIPDAMSLQLSAIDAYYGIRAGPTIRLPTPTAPIPREAMEAYADEALAVFDALLDNALTIKITASYDGEQQMVKRIRESRMGTPVCYQLTVKTTTTVLGASFSVSLPGVPRHLLTIPGGGNAIYTINHARHDLPAIQPLVSFVTHPDFPWVSARGEVGRRVETITFHNYGIKGSGKKAKIGR